MYYHTHYPGYQQREGDAAVIAEGQSLGLCYRGKTFITFIFDSGAIWAINYPLVFVLTRFAPSMPVALIMLAEQLSGLIRCALGYILVKKRIWVNNLTAARK